MLKLSRSESAEYTKNEKIRQKKESDVEKLRKDALTQTQFIKVYCLFKIKLHL